MNLHYGSLYWPSTFPEHSTYPSLKGDKRTRVAIVGGGMSGVTCGYLLAKSGIDTVLLEQRQIASGSSSANTGLLQYLNDTMMTEFASSIGEERAATFYRACEDAAEKIGLIAENLRRDVWFNRRSSLYFASSPSDVPALEKEFDALRERGFAGDWWDGDRIAERFPFRREAAIVTRGDAEINPFRFVHAMAEEAADAGLSIFENTAMTSVERADSGEGYVVRTTEGDIKANHVVYAVGYTPENAGGKWIQASINRSYAIATAPLDGFSGWHERFLLWETARPYLYVRTTPDNRIVAGGLDESVRYPVLTGRELRARSMRLLSEVKKLFPELHPSVRYEWCASFGESADGLPWIGEDPDRPGQYYLLGYGGNGTIYSMIGAEIVRDRLLGYPNEIADIVRPDRPIGQAFGEAAGKGSSS
ncbi:NAD(P)/FAD-dependent oxidoreductase [Cohnella suwonensis]|uniref:NAD(P)/FAD-dependent oxidoreductase n=1 Tax=Cohnella suwonensis TaxID=696072 RepID=A0ABW0LS52_9BACL